MTLAEERNASIQRRTLSAVSWLYGLWTGLIALMAAGLSTREPYDLPLYALHAATLGLAGWLLWKPRRGAMIAALVAAAGSLLMVAIDLHRHIVQSAVIDGLYVPVAALLLYNSRRPA